MSSDWRNDPATEKQKAKLAFFGCTWNAGITKGQAHDAIDECIRQFPDREAAYQNRPATPEQLAILRRYLGSNADELEEYAEDGKPLTYGQAKDLILEWDIPQPSRTKKGARFSKRRSANLSTGTGCLLISVAFILIISFYGGCK